MKVTYRAIRELCQSPEMLLTTIYEMKLGGILLVGSEEPDTIRLLQSTKLPLVIIVFCSSLTAKGAVSSEIDALFNAENND